MDEPRLGVFPLAELRLLGHSRYAIADAISSGRPERVRRGWYAEPAADAHAKLAVHVGGVLTSASAARHYSMWTPLDSRLHVLVPRNASRLRPLPPTAGNVLCLHWAAGSTKATAVAAPLQVVKDAIQCLSFDAAVAMADSALNRHLFELQDLRTISARIAEWADPASQSGTESRCRILLRRKGVRARTQVWIDGVGFVDLVVGQRLVIECDSATFHDGYQSTRDYDRDMALVAQGYIVLRLKYSHVMFEWDRVEALILSIVRARRHLWRAGGAAGTVYSL